MNNNSNSRPPRLGMPDVRGADIVPMHAVPIPLIPRGPGRPRKVFNAPTPESMIYSTEVAKQRTAFVESHPLVKSTAAKMTPEGETAPDSFLRVCLHNHARIFAHLEFSRDEDQKHGGKDIPTILSKMKDILREMADLDMKVQGLVAPKLNLHSDQVQALFALVVDRVKEIAQDVLPGPTYDLFLTRMQSDFKDWEETAEASLR